MNTQHALALQHFQEQKNIEVSQLEKQLNETIYKEQYLAEELDQSKEMQVAIALRFKEDIRMVKDEWTKVLNEKELELKKMEANQSIKLNAVKSEIIQNHQSALQEMQD